MSTLDAAPPRPRTVFANAHFRNLWLGGAVSAFGDQFYLVALPWLVLQLTGSNLAVGTVLMCAAIPRAVLMLGGGAVSDRIAPRRIMLTTASTRTIFVGAVGLLVWLHIVQLWHLGVLAFAFGVADAFGLPAFQSLLPQLIEREQLPSANAAFQSVYQIAMMVGPAPAGIAIKAFGIASAFFIDAVSFLFILAPIYGLPRPAGPHDRGEPLHFRPDHRRPRRAGEVPLRIADGVRRAHLRVERRRTARQHPRGDAQTAHAPRLDDDPRLRRRRRRHRRDRSAARRAGHGHRARRVRRRRRLQQRRADLLVPATRRARADGASDERADVRLGGTDAGVLPDRRRAGAVEHRRHVPDQRPDRRRHHRALRAERRAAPGGVRVHRHPRARAVYPRAALAAARGDSGTRAAARASSRGKIVSRPALKVNVPPMYSLNSGEAALTLPFSAPLAMS